MNLTQPSLYLSIVVPMLNEEDNIIPLLLEIQEELLEDPSDLENTRVLQDYKGNVINPKNLAKPETQRKKFRHYLNFINFSKADSTDTNMVVKLTNTKNQISHR